MKKILLILVLISLFLAPTLNAQLQTSSKIIEISPTEVIETKTCPVGCTCKGDLTICPAETSCQSPCVKSGNTCTCPAQKGTCISHIDNEGCTIVECTDGTSTKTCPTMECKSPCVKSGDTCTCPGEKTWIGTLKKCILPPEIEAWDCGKCYNYVLVLDEKKELTFNDKDFSNLEELVGKRVTITGRENDAVLIMCPIQITATKIELAGGGITCPKGCICKGDVIACPAEKGKTETCPTGCICEGETTTCPTTEIKPIIATVETLTGTDTIQVKKIEDKLQIESGKTSATSKETFVIEESKLYITTSSGNKQIKVLPEEASSKAKVTTVKKIELKEEDSVPVYSVEGTKDVRILSIIPASMEIETKVSAETGDIISTNKPWWSFLAW